MTEETASPQETAVLKFKNKSRVFPLFIAGLICFATALSLGYGAWFYFGSHNWQPVDQVNNATITEQNANSSDEIFGSSSLSGNSSVEQESNKTELETQDDSLKFEGVVRVSGGESVIGGGKTDQPLERSILKDFLIAETEVTNSQYAEFIRDSGHRSPPGWGGDKFPKGKENYPVVNVSWVDANEYCDWLGKKLNAKVRLPNEFEWELAAQGQEDYKYPWGDEWSDEATISKETGQKTYPVKSYSINHSPFGAFDMAGNVWEWTMDAVDPEDKVSDMLVDIARKNGKDLRIIKGGTSLDPRNEIFTVNRIGVPKKSQNVAIGFRYIIEIN